jgi:hypothetical protein
MVLLHSAARALAPTALAFFLVVPARADRPPFSAERLDFRVRFKDEVSTYRVLGVYVVPGRELKLEMEDNGKKTYTVTGDVGSPSRISRGRWKWTAPSRPGLYPVRITQNESGEAMTLNVFVMVPIDSVKNQMLNGYRIGDYFWAKPWDRPIYRPPPGLIEVTPDLLDTRVSPHFTLRQFVCKQASGYPKYMVLRERLLLKLELILQAANEAGYRCDTFAVLSGYRTPWYNKSIGNVKYSRHVWGGAADIFIDEAPKDGMMDDLNKDGKIDVHDAAVLYKIIDQLFGKSFYTPFVGGLGRYKKTANHGPYVHVDARGRRTRWGD